MKGFRATCFIGMAVAISGCAITSSYKHGPNGGSVHMIDGMSASVAYRKADELCPNGYTIIAQEGQKSVMDYVMTVECKDGSTVQPPSVVAPAAVSGVDATLFTAAQNVAAKQYCDSAIKSLFRQGDREMFEATGCPDGHPLQIDCNAGQCRALSDR